MNRRKALSYICVSPMALSATGCAPLLRLIVGAGARSVISRAAIAGGSRAVLTYGRGASIGSRMSLRTTASRSVPATRVVDKRGRLISETRPLKNGTAAYIDNSKVFFSRRTHNGHQHVDKHGDAGRSKDHSEEKIEHISRRGTTLSYDRLRMTKKIIEHYDRDQKLVGETRFIVDRDGSIVSSDEATLKNIESLKLDLGFTCPDVQAAWDKWIKLGDECGPKSQSSCRRRAMAFRRYELLAEQCVIL